MRPFLPWAESAFIVLTSWLAVRKGIGRGWMLNPSSGLSSTLYLVIWCVVAAVMIVCVAVSLMRSPRSRPRSRTSRTCASPARRPQRLKASVDRPRAAMATVFSDLATASSSAPTGVPAHLPATVEGVAATPSASPRTTTLEERSLSSSSAIQFLLALVRTMMEQLLQHRRLSQGKEARRCAGSSTSPAWLALVRTKMVLRLHRRHSAASRRCWTTFASSSAMPA
mmetsp:Transcript_157169/g.504235  ORF Transcript_157169/g.504235 Transcript_157169/m.504235 type:complete len:225 (-) Transcript_157169:201-875(-)